MYNKTGHHTESWDTPTPLSNCHHWCLTGNAWGHSWTRPLIICMRPEVDVRMRWQALECMVRYGGHTQESKDSHACADHHSGWRRVTLRRRLGHSVENRIRTWLKLRVRNIMNWQYVWVRMKSVISIKLNITQYYIIFTLKWSVKHRECTDIT